jgi:hypothetical protein
MRSHKFISILILSAAVAWPAVAATGHNAITTQQIAAAINSAGIKVSADQVVLLTDVTATTNDPALKVESMERWGDRRLRVRLNCAKEGECLPFFVAVNWSEAEAGRLAVADLSSSAISKTGPNAYVVRAGSPAILLIEGDHIHIQIQVVCLENGAAGQTIRATSKDHRQTYTAKVGEDAVLRGKL